MRRLALIAAIALAAAPLPALAQSAAELRELAANFGLTPPQARQVFARYDAQAARIAALADTAKLDRRLLRSAALRLGASKPDHSAEAFLRLVEAKANEARAAQAQIVQLEALIAGIREGPVRGAAETVLREGRAAFDEGRLEAAESAFARLEFLRRSDLAEARTAWKQAVSTQMDVLALAGNNEAASAVADRAIAAIADQARQDSWDLANQNGLQWLDRGKWSDSAATERALGIFRDSALRFAPPEAAPLDWARTQYNIGQALNFLGIQQGDPKRFEQAVAAYREGLAKALPERSPFDRAMLQDGLCTALANSMTAQANAQQLEQVLDACRASLEGPPVRPRLWEWNHKREKVARMHGQLSLLRGAPDPVIAQACGGFPPSTLMVTDLSEEQAEQASAPYADILLACGRPDLAEPRYRAVLAKLDRRQAPREWARAQVGIGDATMTALSLNAFGLLDFEDEAPAHLTELHFQQHDAAARYRLALEVLTADSAPAEWIAARRKLAKALGSLGGEYLNAGDRAGAARQFAEAVAIRRQVVEWYSRRADLPVVAAAQAELGLDLVGLYMSSGETRHLAEAIAMLEPVQAALRTQTAPWVEGVKYDVEGALESARQPIIEGR